MLQLHYNIRASPSIVSPLSTETTFDWQLIGINEMTMFSYSFLYFGQPGCCVPNVAGLVLSSYLILSYTMGEMLYAYIC